MEIKRQRCTNSAAVTLKIFLLLPNTLVILVHPCVFMWQDGGTALTVASQYGHSKVVDILLKNGANVHDQLNVRLFAFTSAASRSQYAVTVLSVKSICLSETQWLAAHIVPAIGIQPLRFLQTAESDMNHTGQDNCVFPWCHGKTTCLHKNVLINSTDGILF